MCIYNLKDGGFIKEHRKELIRIIKNEKKKINEQIKSTNIYVIHPLVHAMKYKTHPCLTSPYASASQTAWVAASTSAACPRLL